MQAKEWTRTFGRCKPMKHAVTKQQSKHECTGKNRARRSREAPRPVGLGRLAYPLRKPSSAFIPQVSHLPSSLFVCSSL
jgi:hypothetical protein